MKKLFSLLSVLFLLPMLCGCFEIDYAIKSNEDGSIYEHYRITLDSARLYENNIDARQVFNEIENQIISYCENQELDKKGISCYIRKNTEDFCITLSINYPSQEIYQEFWGQDDEPNLSVQFCFLYDMLILNQSSIDVQNLKKNSFAKYFYDYCQKNFGQINWDESNFKFSYIYQTSSKSLYSNADQVLSDGNIFSHIWQFSLADSQKDLLFFVPIVQAHNIACWLVLILVLTGSFGLFLFIYFKKSKKNEILRK